jgi:hypothetical protein
MEEPSHVHPPGYHRIWPWHHPFRFGPHQPDHSELWCSYNNTIIIVVIVLLIPCREKEGSPTGALPGIPLMLAGRDNRGSKEHCPWPERSSSTKPESPRLLPWLMWRKYFWKNQFRFLRNTSSLLYLIIGILQDAFWGRSPWRPQGHKKLPQRGRPDGGASHMLHRRRDSGGDGHAGDNTRR